MDSLTQFALGAAVGQAVLGKKIGNKAMLWGGICGTIPDLDVFIPMGNAIANFTYHRSFSHSFFVLALITPLVAWIGMKVSKQSAGLKYRWWCMVYLVFATHVILDCFTAYGTQVFWPLLTTPVSFSTLFIVDPFYTAPLIGGLIMVLIQKNNGTNNWNTVGIVLSCVYLSWSVIAKVYVDQQIHQGLAKQGVTDYKLFTTPSPLNTFLWRGVARTEIGYYEVYYSVFDDFLPVNNLYFESDEELLHQLKDEWSVSRLKWFTRGFYRVKQVDKTVVVSDLRMGFEPKYVFQFVIAENNGGVIKPTAIKQLQPSFEFSALENIWRRIWTSDVQVSPS